MLHQPPEGCRGQGGGGGEAEREAQAVKGLHTLPFSSLVQRRPGLQLPQTKALPCSLNTFSALLN